eukprot:9687296-Alexandrium_andersonii.AAC.1
MSASLVGSEMCIRDRPRAEFVASPRTQRPPANEPGAWPTCLAAGRWSRNCLLYTSDAADDM